jgi:hypothetical protein
LKDGINLHKFIKEAVKVVQQNMTYEKTRRLMDGVLENVKNLKSHKVFIAGAKALDRERDGIRSVLSQLSNKGDIIFQSWTFEDFDRSFTKDGRQCDYDSFIRESADSVVFVLDERIGGITLSEFDIAIDSYQLSERPLIFVYCHEGKDEDFDREIEFIKERIDQCHQYYTDYTDLKDLKNQVRRDFSALIR